MAAVLVMPGDLASMVLGADLRHTGPGRSAQDPEDPRGLYESNGPLTRQSSTPKAGNTAVGPP